MTLAEYFADKPKGAKTEMCQSIGISRTWMALLIAGTHIPSAEVCVEIEKYTKGAVTRKELRPDLFGDLR